MNEQEIFDIVRRHLIKQRVRSIDDIGRPRYRAGKKMCAIGVLIPNDLYNPSMEYNSVTRLCEEVKSDGHYKFTLPDYFRANVRFLNTLQLIHDRSFNFVDPSRWDLELQVFARRRGLTCSS